MLFYLYNFFSILRVPKYIVPVQAIVPTANTYLIDSVTMISYLDANFYNHLILQYMSRLDEGRINRLIEKAILDAEKMGVKVLSLGLFNQVSDAITLP